MFQSWVHPRFCFFHKLYYATFQVLHAMIFHVTQHFSLTGCKEHISRICGPPTRQKILLGNNFFAKHLYLLLIQTQELISPLFRKIVAFFTASSAQRSKKKLCCCCWSCWRGNMSKKRYKITKNVSKHKT